MLVDGRSCPNPPALTPSDQPLEHIQFSDDLFRKTFRRLQSTCSYHEVLPTSYAIPSENISHIAGPFAAGGFANVWSGVFKEGKVCIKRLRLNTYGGNDAIKKVCPLIAHHRCSSLKQPRRFTKKLLCGKRCTIRTLFLASEFLLGNRNSTRSFVV